MRSLAHNRRDDGVARVNWDAIAAIAELMAAIGVIISLIFVGVQVRKSNAEARSATMQATTDTEIAMVATHADHVETWNKVVTGVPIEDSVELRRGILLFNLLMIDYENRFHQFQAGNLDVRSWSQRLEILHQLVILPIYDHWRKSPGGRSHGAVYLDLVDEISQNVNESKSTDDDASRRA